MRFKSPPDYPKGKRLDLGLKSHRSRENPYVHSSRLRDKEQEESVDE